MCVLLSPAHTSVIRLREYSRWVLEIDTAVNLHFAQQGI